MSTIQEKFNTCMVKKLNAKEIYFTTVHVIKTDVDSSMFLFTCDENQDVILSQTREQSREKAKEYIDRKYPSIKILRSVDLEVSEIPEAQKIPYTKASELLNRHIAFHLNNGSVYWYNTIT